MEYQPLTDLQWQLLEPLFPAPIKRGRGKPHAPWRAVVNSILWVLHSKSKWSAIPEGPEFASKSSSHRWFLAWEKSGKLEEILAACQRFCEISKELAPQRRNRQKEEWEAPVAVAYFS